MNTASLEFKSTKTGEVDTVALNSLALAALPARRAVQNGERLGVGDAYHNSDLVFANAIGEPWNPDSVSNAFRKLAKAVNLSTKRLHDVRHTAGTWMLQGGG